MTTELEDELFMERAINLARETTSLASPNPQVGCVLVSNHEVVAEGVHLYAKRDHAEIAALKQAQERGIPVAGTTAYVTLEPCSHHGRTGPCSDALVAARVGRVVIATEDPNPQVSGRGIARLRAANIEVTLGTLQQQARDLNEAFAHFIQRRVPLVTLKAALSVDGYLAPAAETRTQNQPYWLTGAAARAEVQRLRHTSDAVLTGIGTVLADNPALTDRSGILGFRGQFRRRPLLRVILDRHLRTPLGSTLVQSADHDLLIFTSRTTSPEKLKTLREKGVEVETVAEESGQLSLPTVLAALGDRNLLSVLLECGSRLNGAFLRQDLVDKAVLFYSETELGPHSLPFAEGIASPYLFQQSLHRTSRARFETDACITGYLHDAWDQVPSPV